jgi:hypothetical protein
MQRRTVRAIVVGGGRGPPPPPTAVGGCGGGDKPLTHAQFVTRMEGLCKQMRARGAATFKRAGKRGLPELRRELKVVLRRSLDRFDDVKPPAADRDRFDRYVKTLTTEITIMTSRDAMTPAGSRRQADATHRASRLAAGMGLRSC